MAAMNKDNQHDYKVQRCLEIYNVEDNIGQKHK